MPTKAKRAVTVKRRTAPRKTTVTKTAKEAIGPNLFALTASNDPNDWTYRRITSPNTLRDLNPFMQQRMQQVAFYLKATNPLAKRVVEIISDYVVGDGLQVSCSSDAVQEVVDKFWNDPINRMDKTIRDWCDEKTTFGELCVPVMVNRVDGFVRFGYIDPLHIDYIRYGAIQNGEGQQQEISIPYEVHLKERYNEALITVLQLIRPDEDPQSETYGRMSGDCFYWAINKAKAASRGLSELFSLSDWLDLLDQVGFDFGDRVRFLNQFIWDFTLKGADEKTVKKFTQDISKNPPRQGGYQVHNEQAEIKALTPSFAGSDMNEVLRALRLHMLGGAGLPPTFFGDGLEANRATADEMTGPVGKKLAGRQNDLIRDVSDMVTFVIDQAIAHGVISEREDTSFKIEAPELMLKDLQKAADTLNGLTQSLSAGVEQGWVRNETAARGFHLALSQIGLDIDSAEEYKQAQQEKDAKDIKLQNAMNPQKNLKDALDALNAQPPVDSAEEYPMDPLQSVKTAPDTRSVQQGLTNQQKKEALMDWARRRSDKSSTSETRKMIAREPCRFWKM
jgi:hypothetical protein